MRHICCFLLSSLAGALACSAEAPVDAPANTNTESPGPGTASVAQCLPGTDGPQCPRNGQTGSLGRGDDYGIGYPYGVGLGCPAEVTELDPQADTGLGFDAQALVELVSGAHRESLLWLPAVAGAPGVGAPASSTSTQLSVELEVIGAAQLLTREERKGVVPASAPPGAVPGAHCPTAVGLPVRVRLQTDDGTLDVTVETMLESSRGDFARLAFVLPGGELMGSASSDRELAVELGVTPLGIMGSLSWYLLKPQSDGSSDLTLSPLAHFPAQKYCTPPRREGTRYNYTSQLHLAPDQEFRGISIDNQLARLNRTSPVSAHPLGITSRRPLSLTFASTDDHLCLELESRGCSAGLANVAATVRMSTDDGEIDGELPLSLFLFDGGELPSISAVAYRSATTLDEVPGLLQGSGIHAAIDYTGQASAAVLFSALLEGEDFQGSLTVIGRGDTLCNTELPDGPQCLHNSPIWLLDWGGTPYPYEENFCGAPRPLRG